MARTSQSSFMRGGCAFIGLGMVCGAVLGLFTVFNLLVEAGGSFGAVTQPGGGGIRPPRAYTPGWALVVIGVAVFVLPATSALITGIRSKVPLIIAGVFDLVALGATLAVVGNVKTPLTVVVLIHLIAVVFFWRDVQPREWIVPVEGHAGTPSIDRPVSQPTLARFSSTDKSKENDSIDG